MKKSIILFSLLIASGNCFAGEIHEAVIKDRLDEVKRLIEKEKFDVNAKEKKYYDETPLHLARKKDIAEYLIKKGAIVNAKNKYSETPLQVTLGLMRNLSYANEEPKLQKLKEIAATLIKHGANIGDLEEMIKDIKREIKWLQSKRETSKKIEYYKKLHKDLKNFLIETKAQHGSTK